MPSNRNMTLRLKTDDSLAQRMCLGVAMLTLSGCGFVIAPLEIVTLGTLSTLVKEFDNQLNPSENSATSPNLNQPNELSGNDLPNSGNSVSEVLPSPAWPSSTTDRQITRPAIMPD